MSAASARSTQISVKTGASNGTGRGATWSGGAVTAPSGDN
jgi:hypothetical protein